MSCARNINAQSLPIFCFSIFYFTFFKLCFFLFYVSSKFLCFAPFYFTFFKTNTNCHFVCLLRFYVRFLSLFQFFKTCSFQFHVSVSCSFQFSFPMWILNTYSSFQLSLYWIINNFTYFSVLPCWHFSCCHILYYIFYFLFHYYFIDIYELFFNNDFVLFSFSL
jgi:hypothetical protein